MMEAFFKKGCKVPSVAHYMKKWRFCALKAGKLQGKKHTFQPSRNQCAVAGFRWLHQPNSLKPKSMGGWDRENCPIGSMKRFYLRRKRCLICFFMAHRIGKSISTCTCYIPRLGGWILMVHEFGKINIPNIHGWSHHSVCVPVQARVLPFPLLPVDVSTVACHNKGPHLQKGNNNSNNNHPTTDNNKVLWVSFP